ncbi:MAG TPA: hypothetical protein PKJ68_05370 [Candidatus Woesebacteria bacterium]|jgi:hypothetical protein|nr:hypothetical protein [Candidatus Woesebacteria bacterium]
MPTVEEAKKLFCRVSGANQTCVAKQCMHWIEGSSAGFGDCAFTLIAKGGRR